MNRIKVWPHLTIVAVSVALVAAVVVAFWMKYEPTTSDEELPSAARIQRVDGDVAFSDSVADVDAEPDWTAATPNQPFSVGDRIYTRDNARTSLAFSGRNFARLNPNTSLDVVSLSDRRTQLALREGSATFDLGYLAPDELFEVATPYGAVNFDEPGLYDVGFDNNAGVLVSVLSGLAKVVGQAGSGEINKGEVLTLVGQAASELVLSRLNGDDAGSRVDDYYRYQYPNEYDGRYNNYDAYLEDPSYYDPYKRNPSYEYASAAIPGIHDLVQYGDWQDIDGYGQAWKPRVEPDWVPYQQGQWTNDYPYGPTWVSNEPWGYAPYHYGRWANVGNQWYWIPDRTNTTPTYAPALVAFVPMDNENQIGWVPLAPGEAYTPHYYDDKWQPQYATQASVAPEQLINLAIPGAVTVVPIDAFGRVVEARNVRRVDQQKLAAVRTTLDPLTVTPLRNAVTQSAWGRGKISLPPGIAKKLQATPIFVGADIRESRFRRNLARSMRVERISDNDRNRRFRTRDNRGDSPGGRDDRDNGREARGDDGRRQADDARKLEIERLNGEANRGNRDARRQARQLEQQQRQSERDQAKAVRDQQQAERKAAQQPQGEPVGNPGRQGSREAERKRDSSGRGGNDNERGDDRRGGKGRGRGRGKG